MGLPSGLKWAPMNIDGQKERGFASSPFQYDCSFVSWGNVEPHNPINESRFDYNWGGANAQEPWYDGQVYGSTPGSELETNIDIEHDVVRKICGDKWRMPTTEEFDELLSNCDFVQADGTTVIDAGQQNKIVSVNGVLGIYLKSKLNDNLLFFACAGYGGGNQWSDRAASGSYWSSTLASARDAKRLSFYGGGTTANSSVFRFRGLPVRPVYDNNLV